MGSCIRSLIYLLYFIVGFFFWFSIYKLLEQKTQNPSIHQYIIIGGYFFVEIFTGLVKCCDKVEKTPEEAIRNIDATLAGVSRAEKDLLNRGEQRFGRKFKDIADLKYYMDNERYGDFYKIDKSKVTRHL